MHKGGKFFEIRFTIAPHCLYGGNLDYVEPAIQPLRRASGFRD
jgi:hypothetical protein